MHTEHYAVLDLNQNFCSYAKHLDIEKAKKLYPQYFIYM